MYYILVGFRAYFVVQRKQRDKLISMILPLFFLGWLSAGSGWKLTIVCQNDVTVKSSENFSIFRKSARKSVFPVEFRKTISCNRLPRTRKIQPRRAHYSEKNDKSIIFSADTIRKRWTSEFHRCFGVVNDFYTASSWQLCCSSWTR